MTNKTLLKAGAVLVAMAVSSMASAATVKLQTFTGEWLNVTGTPTNLGFVGNPGNDARVNWGDPIAAGNFLQSGYQMDLAPVDAPPFNLPPIIIQEVNPPPVTDPFRIGRFTHFNNTIGSNTSITGVDLRIAFEVLIDDVSAGTKTFTFNFAHLETPNRSLGAKCPDGGTVGVGVNINGCADRVTFSPVDITDTFTIEGVKYTFELVGFSNADPCTDDSIIAAFWTVEKQDNGACLFARIRAVQTPEPGSLALLGLGLLGLGLSRRKAS